MGRLENLGDEGYIFSYLGAAVLDADGTVAAWSDQAAALLDLPADDVIGHPFRRLLIDAPGFPLLAHPPASGVAYLRHGSTGRVQVSMHLIGLHAESPRYLLLLTPAETAAEWGHAMSLLRAILRQDTLGLGIHGSDLRVVLTNVTPQGLQAPPVAPGHQLRDYLAESDAADIESVFLQVMRTGQPIVSHKQRTRAYHAPHRYWDFSVSAFRLEDAQDQPIGVAALVSDITEQERIRRHRELLHRAAVHIGPSMNANHISLALAKVVVNGLADLATVDLYQPVLLGDIPPTDPGGGKTGFARVAATATTGQWPAELLQVGGAYPTLPDSPRLRQLQQGHALILDRKQVEQALGDARLVKLMVPAEATSLAVSPLLARGSLLGSVTAWRTSGSDPFDQSELELLSEIASRAALGIENARRYTREHIAAVTLQERLLPPPHTDMLGAETAGAYRSADGGEGVSGDWFDVIDLPSLRVAFVIGDVTGHGLAAAATMGRLRTAVQTYADLELAPGELLAQVEHLVERLAAETAPEQRDTVGATCLYAVYDPTTCQCTLASAGHPPPILITPNGATRVLDLPLNPPLGVGWAPFQSISIEVEPGSVLAMYTDGLFQLDRRNRDLDLDRVQSELAASGGQALSLREWCNSLAPDATNITLPDDFAILLARTRAVGSQDVSSWQFPADLTSVAKARTLVVSQLTDWHLDHLVFTTELVVSELITNAIRYAGGPVSLRLIRGKTLICEVADHSNTQPRLVRAATTDEGGRGLYIVAQCTSRWGCRYGEKGKTIWTELPLNNEGA